MKKINLGYAMCASYCTIPKSLKIAKEISKKYHILPIFSENLLRYDTRFGEAKKIKEEMENMTIKKSIFSILDAEPIGPKNMIDVMLISPCTGNTLSKITRAITDSVVTMAVKSHLRTLKPLVIALATNDALGASLENISKALNTKNIYFVPMFQDDPILKPNSLVADFDMIPKTIELALNDKQNRPIFKTVNF